MPITDRQRALAQERQWAAARDTSPQVRLVAGPGTGKSHTIEKRIADLLTGGIPAENIYAISFTRAACAELSGRVQLFCSTLSCADVASGVRISTMHSLALRILRRANLLTSYPSTPMMLDNWEQSTIYDRELASSIGCSPSRAGEIRRAYDAHWQTLNPDYLNQARITTAEITGFRAFHAARTNLYCCVLPGEVIFKCVDALQHGALQQDQLPRIDHLIVDEYQDLNACDQEFVRLLCSQGTILFIAGDDDQSIYSFRHANPEGIITFPITYPQSSTHILTDCFRCTPAVLAPANRLITFNPSRVPKQLDALYGTAEPPVAGQVAVWSFSTAQQEAQAIAKSCKELLDAGLSGRENEILILVANRRVQLNLITQELGNLGLPYEPPKDASLTGYASIRVIYSILRLVREQATGEADYPAYRDVLELLHGVGQATAKSIADDCITHNQNYRDLYHLQSAPRWLAGRASAAVQRVISIVQAVSSWVMSDTLSARSADMEYVLRSLVFTTGGQATTAIAEWNTLSGALPQEMTLEELLQFLSADTETEQQAILDIVSQRIGTASQAAESNSHTPGQKKIRILTMHGAKGLSGKIVFIPSAEQGIMPNSAALQATGLLIEQRRLFYVSLTRAMACCIISHAAQHTGAAAMTLAQRSSVRLPRSQFLSEMGVTSVNRAVGLSQAEASRIIIDVNNL